MDHDTAATFSAYRSVLKRELVCALGCTEPIAVAYAAALARKVLGAEPTHLLAGCSGNIIKNVKSVTVPNSDGMHGIEAAATLGAVGGNAESALEVLESVTSSDIARTRELVADPAYCTVELVEDVPNLYIDITAEAAGHTARVVIAEHHTDVALVERDGEELYRAGTTQGAPDPADAQAANDLLTIEGILAFADAGALGEAREVLERQLMLNDAISREGLDNPWGAEVGRTLIAHFGESPSVRARARAAAGSDARMNGCPKPVVINCGSGNQGITCALPVLEYAEATGVDRERLLCALAVSDLTAVHLKSYIGSLSAFCGVVCAAAGAGAGIAWMEGCDYDVVAGTIINTIGNVGGIVCDGAKSSCAAKISTAVDAALVGLEMARSGNGFHAGEGLVRGTLEETIASMGYVGRVGMKPTDVENLNIMIGKTDVAGC